jgi:hypothetical protein
MGSDAWRSVTCDWPSQNPSRPTASRAAPDAVTQNHLGTMRLGGRCRDPDFADTMSSLRARDVLAMLPIRASLDALIGTSISVEGVQTDLQHGWIK